jgi:ectoine hydroxylase-related dioxygenase (phytanoyl-CoA dioxygenase family)
MLNQVQMKHNLLTQKDIDKFYEEGYVIVRNVWNAEEVAYLKSFFKEKFASGFWKVSEYNSATIINDIYRHFPELADIIFKPQYIQAVREVLGGTVIAMPECSIHYNRYFDWHKDTTHMHATQGIDPKKQTGIIVQSGFYLQDNFPTGGGLSIVPKSMKLNDRFVSMHYGSLWKRVYNKGLKMLKYSVFDRIERKEKPIDLDTKAGDLLIFNNQLDHRATFKRGVDGKPLPDPNEKLVVFNTFSNDKAFLDAYYQSMCKLNESYSKYLRNTTSAPDVVRKAKELDFDLCY